MGRKIENDERFKEVSIDDLEVSLRFSNCARRGGIFNLYDLINSYNAGTFQEIRGVGTGMIRELLGLDTSKYIDFHETEKAQEKEESHEPKNDEDNDEITEEILNSHIDKYILDYSIFNHLTRHGIETIRDLMNLDGQEMLKWHGFGMTKYKAITEFRKRLKSGEACFMAAGTVKTENDYHPSREIDPDTLDILKKEYGFKMGWLCEWFGVTRQRMDQKVKTAKKKHAGRWTGFSYTAEESETIILMLREREENLVLKGNYYYFLRGKNGDCAVLIITEESIRVFFEKDLKGDLKDYILRNKINEFSFHEMDIAKRGKTISVLKKHYFVPAPEDVKTFSDNARRKGMNKNEYSRKLTGMDYSSDVKITDEYIIDFFNNHLDAEGRVYISADPSNQWIKSYASRNGFKIADFIEFYGYQSALGKDWLTAEGAHKRHLERLKDFVIHDNLVYIPTTSDFYRVLNAYSGKRSMTITEYVRSLGYERSLTPPSSGSWGDDDGFDPEESDMEVISSEGSFVEKIFAGNPLLGNYVFSGKNLHLLHEKAKRLIDHVVADHSFNLSHEEKMVVALSVINYAKGWDTDLGTFTNYITKQYGYRSEDRVYPRIVSATYDAIIENNRWAFSSHGSIQYKSTIMIHAMGSIRSWMHLCDFLSDFYQNNLNCNYVSHDPYILNMVMYLRSIFYSSEVGNEDENYSEFMVSSKPYRFQEGIRKLVVFRPNYASVVFDRMLHRIHGYMNGETLPSSNYEDQLIDLWFKNKTEYYFNLRKERENGRRFETRRVAVDYSRISIEYKLIRDELVLDIPDIRLNSSNDATCYFEIYDGEHLVERKTTKWYGNELGKTIAGFTYPLKDYIAVKTGPTICPRIVIKYGEDVIYDSELNLERKILYFEGPREIEAHALKPGSYVAFSPAQTSISGFNIEVSPIKTVEQYKYCYLELLDDFSLTIDDIIVAFDRKRIEKIHVNIPNTVRDAIYVENGINYEICSAVGNLSIAVDEQDVEQKYVILFNGKRINFTDLQSASENGIKNYLINGDARIKSKNRLQIVDFSSEKLVVDKWFVLIDGFSYELNRYYYFTKQEVEECSAEVQILDDTEEFFNDGDSDVIKFKYRDGYISISIPMLQLVGMKGDPWESRDYFIDEIDRGLYLKEIIPSGVEVSLSIGGSEVNKDTMGLLGVGAVAHSISGHSKADINLSVIDSVGKRSDYKLGRIIYKEQFVSKPELEYVNGQVVWNLGYGFLGNKEKITKLEICDKKGASYYEGEINFDSSVLVNSIELPDGVYHYSIFRGSESLFSTEKEILAEGSFVAGSIDRVRFDDCTLVISEIVFDNAVESGVREILPVYVDDIHYNEQLSKEEGSEGICPTYTGTMYFINPEGGRHNYAFEREERSDTDIRLKTNPVRIVYINDSVLLITDCDGDGLMYRSYFDKKQHKRVFHITDHEQNIYEKDNYDTVDLLRYEKRG